MIWRMFGRLSYSLWHRDLLTSYVSASSKPSSPLKITAATKLNKNSRPTPNKRVTRMPVYRHPNNSSVYSLHVCHCYLRSFVLIIQLATLIPSFLDTCTQLILIIGGTRCRYVRFSRLLLSIYLQEGLIDKLPNVCSVLGVEWCPSLLFYFQTFICLRLRLLFVEYVEDDM